jgi:hypothetical protein
MCILGRSLLDHVGLFLGNVSKMKSTEEVGTMRTEDVVSRTQQREVVVVGC